MTPAETTAPQRVPTSALILSLLALLIPAFLLAYHRTRLPGSGTADGSFWWKMRRPFGAFWTPICRRRGS
jgi:hypothetical protein